MQRSSTYVWGNLMQFHSTSGLACRASRLPSGRRSGRPSSCGSLAAVQEPHAAHRDVRQVDTPEVHAETLDVWSGIFMRQFSMLCRHGRTFTVQRVMLQLTRRGWTFTVQRVRRQARRHIDRAARLDFRPNVSDVHRAADLEALLAGALDAQGRTLFRRGWTCRHFCEARVPSFLAWSRLV